MKHVMNNFFTAKSFTALTLCSLFFTCLTSDILAAPRTAIQKKDKPVVENKANQFNQVLSSTNESSNDTSANDLADKIRKQREAIEARENASLVQSNQQMALKGGQNACDSGLRQCMQKTCGNDFTKCSLDGDTILGDKFNKCKRDTKCTTEEFNLFIKEIKADMELNVQLASYNAVIECGNKYNACIQKECGDTFGKCLGKKYEDRATQACESIAKNCREQDSGLAARFGVVAGRLREDAEKDIKADEERMYKLRDLMRGQCEKLGAMFDERSFDCVYTVNFFAGENQSKPMASRKAYAGSSFTCMQEWFGVNVTTYKENAYRETRAQTAASSAMLGSGVGTAVGLVTSGAMGRALDTQKAKKDLKSECESQGGVLKNGECKAKDGKKIDIDEDKGNKDNPEEEKPEDPKGDNESEENPKGNEKPDAVDNLIDAQKRTEEAKKKYDANPNDATAQAEYVAASRSEGKAMAETITPIQKKGLQLGSTPELKIEPRDTTPVNIPLPASDGGNGGNGGDGTGKKVINAVGNAGKQVGKAVGNAAKKVTNVFRKKENRI